MPAMRATASASPFFRDDELMSGRTEELEKRRTQRAIANRAVGGLVFVPAATMSESVGDEGEEVEVGGGMCTM